MLPSGFMTAERQDTLRAPEQAMVFPEQAMVFIVDDDPSARASLEPLIRSAGWSARTFMSAEAFLARHAEEGPAPSCLVLDVRLPERSGLDLQRRLASDCSDMPVIFVTGQGDIPMTVRAMGAGAIDFMTKPFDQDAMLGAIRGALTRSRAALAREASARRLRTRYARLTPRERDVMAAIVSGLSNKQAAAALGNSEVTVKAHRGQVMRKMEASSFAELVRMAAAMPLLPAAGPQA